MNTLERLARLGIRAPRRIIALALFAMVATAVFGLPVTHSLSAGGFQDPNAESTRATNMLATRFNQGDTQLLITVSSDDGIKSGAAERVGTDIVRQLGNSPYVARVTSPWTAPPSASAALISKDGKVGLIVASITGGSNAAGPHAETLSDQVVHSRDGVTVRAGGQAMTDAQITSQTRKDLKVMETIAVPVSFLVLVWVFGGFVAAAIPLAVGGIAIFGSMAVLRALTCVTDVTIFALNLLLAMGLALAIDYTLLILSRFRDEIDSGAERDAALVRTMVSAGRSVLFSATTISLSMSALMLFPMPFLKSFAYAAIAVVALAVAAAIVVTPAAIALLGPRLDSRRFRRAPRPVEQTFFYRLAHFVMRRAVPLGLALAAVLVALGMPLFGMKWGIPDDRVLPTSNTARQVGDQLRTGFTADVATSLTVVIPDVRGLTPKALDAYAAQLSTVPDVPSVSAPSGTFVAGALVGPPTAAAGVADGSAFLTVASSAPLFSAASNAQLDRIHAVAGPGGRAGADHRDRPGEPRYRRCHHLPAVPCPERHRPDHFRGDVPTDRQRGIAVENVAAQWLIADRVVRRTRVDLPGRPPRRIGDHRHRHPGAHHAGRVVLHRVRLVDGLRGVPGVADLRVLAHVQPDGGRQRPRRGARPGQNGARHYRRRVGHVDLFRRADRCAGVVHADVRGRADAGGAVRRDSGTHAARAGVHARDGTGELVGTEMGFAAARTVPCQRPHRSAPTSGRPRPEGLRNGSQVAQALHLTISCRIGALVGRQ